MHITTMQMLSSTGCFSSGNLRASGNGVYLGCINEGHIHSSARTQPSAVELRNMTFRCEVEGRRFAKRTGKMPTRFDMPFSPATVASFVATHINSVEVRAVVAEVEKDTSSTYSSYHAIISRVEALTYADLVGAMLHSASNEFL